MVSCWCPNLMRNYHSQRSRQGDPIDNSPTEEQLSQIASFLEHNDVVGLRRYLLENPGLIEGDSALSFLLRSFMYESNHAVFLARYAESATRIFAGPSLDTSDFAALGIVIFKSRATSYDRERYRIICEAYVSALPHSTETGLPSLEQMVTVWPVEEDAVSSMINGQSREQVCDIAVSRYSLAASKAYGRRANSSGVSLSGRGPFIVAWAPSSEMDSPDSQVLVADLSSVDSIREAKSVFETWGEQIQGDSSTWSDGWNLDKLGATIRNWLDDNGNIITVLQ
jgi:hypothetical protein